MAYININTKYYEGYDMYSASYLLSLNILAISITIVNNLDFRETYH